MSQGDKLNVDFGNGSAAKVLGRLADNLHDLEVIELDQAPYQTLGIYLQDGDVTQLQGYGNLLSARSKLAPTLTGAAVLHYSRVLHDNDFTDRLRSWIFLPSSSLISVVKTNGMVGIGKDYSFLPTVTWAAFQPKGSQEKLDSDAAKQWGLKWCPFSDEVAVGFDVAPGYSGAPMIRAEDNVFAGRTMRVEGIVSRRNRELNQTFLVSSETLHRLLTDYLKGSRGWTDETRWKYSNVFGTYRDLGEGSFEANLISQVTGNGHSSDGGNGHSSDGGNGHSSDGGHGLSSDGGNGLSSDGGEPNSSHKTGLPAGMIWKGNPIYGFKLAFRTTDHAESVAHVYGDLASVQLVTKAKEQNKSTPIDVNTPLSTILRERLHLPEGPFTLISSESDAVADSPIVIRFDGSRFHFEMKKPTSMSFDLDDRAVLVPFISPKTSDGRKISIDLHELFFVDLSMIRSEEELPPSDYAKRDLIEAAERVPLIRLSEEGHIEFQTMTLKAIGETR